MVCQSPAYRSVRAGTFWPAVMTLEAACGFFSRPRHQEHEHPRSAGRPTGQTDCRVHRADDPDRDLSLPRRCRYGVAGDLRSGTEPVVPAGLEVVGGAGTHRAADHREESWVPAVREADALLVWGGDVLYLSHWMRQSGLADLLPSLSETVYVGVSAGSIVVTPYNCDAEFDLQFVPAGSDRRWEATEHWAWWISRCTPTSIARGWRTRPGQHRKVGVRDTGPDVRHRRQHRHQGGRRHRRSRLRRPLETVTSTRRQAKRVCGQRLAAMRERTVARERSRGLKQLSSHRLDPLVLAVGSAGRDASPHRPLGPAST